jgi:hypothetical protein
MAFILSSKKPVQIAGLVNHKLEGLMEGVF